MLDLQFFFGCELSLPHPEGEMFLAPEAQFSLRYILGIGTALQLYYMAMEAIKTRISTRYIVHTCSPCLPPSR